MLDEWITWMDYADQMNRTYKYLLRGFRANIEAVDNKTTKEKLEVDFKVLKSTIC